MELASSSGLLKFMGGIPELRRLLFCAGSSCSGSSGGSEEGACCPEMDDARRVESVEVVLSCGNSMSWNVCSVASAANETRRFARDLRRASRRLSSAFCASSRSRSSRSRAAACCCSSVRRAIFVPDALLLSVFSGVEEVEGLAEVSCALDLCGGISGMF